MKSMFPERWLCIYVVLYIRILYIPGSASESSTIDLNPFLSYTRNCYTELIVVTSLDFAPFKNPVALSQLSWTTRTYTGNYSEECPVTTRYISERIQVQYSGNICIPVRKNYLIKGINCVSIIPVFMENPSALRSLDEYIWRHWNRADFRPEVVWMNGNRIQFVSRLFDILPTIYFQVILKHDVNMSHFGEIDEDLKLRPLYSEIPIQYFHLSKSQGKAKLYIEPWDGHGATDTGLEVSESSGLTRTNVMRAHLTILRRADILFCFKGGTLMGFDNLAKSLGLALNASATSNCYLRPTSRRRIIHITLNSFNDIYLQQSSRGYTMYLERPVYALQTCDNRLAVIQFMDLLFPFDKSVWIGVAIALAIGSLLLEIFHKYKHINTRSLILLISALLEHPYEIRHKLTEWCAFNSFYVAFLSACIVLSNGYKGVLIPAIVSPLARVGMSTVAEAISANYTLKFGLYDTFKVTEVFQRSYAYCCLEVPGGLLGYVDTHHMNGLNFSKSTWKDKLTEIYFSTFLDKDTSLYLNVLATELGKGYRTIKPKKQNFKTNSDWIIAQLIKIAEPHSCSNAHNFLSVDTECNGILTFSHAAVAKYYKDWLRFEGKEYYEIREGRTQGNPNFVKIIPVTYAPEYLRRICNTFFYESGTYGIIQSWAQLRLYRTLAHQTRKRVGSIKEVWRDPYKLSLSTRLTTVFTVWCGYLGFTIVSFMLEIYYYRYSYCTTKNNVLPYK